MPFIEIKKNPSPTELRVFALLWAVFFGALGKMALGTPHALVVAAAVTGAALAVSLVFNRDQPLRAQLIGIAIPAALLLIGVAEHLGAPAWAVAVTTWILGVAGALAALASRTLAGRLYAGWMNAAVPLGWTFSHALLALVFFLVAAPIGLIMRALGHDPLGRQPGRGATTFWRTREATPPADRYFRQF